MKLPKHYTITIEHNPHKSCYNNVQEYIDMWDHFIDCITPEDLKICIQRNELWSVQWYPNTPISFTLILSYSLERCLELCNEELYDYL